MSNIEIDDCSTTGDRLIVETIDRRGDGLIEIHGYEDTDTTQVNINFEGARQLVGFLQEHLPTTAGEDATKVEGTASVKSAPGVWAVLQRLDTGGVEAIVAVYAQDREIDALRQVNEIGGVYARFIQYGEPVNGGRAEAGQVPR